jgi:thiosulfate dehydrogenase
MRHAWLLLAVAACGAQPNTAVKYGEQVFHDARFAQSGFNKFSCATCHATRASDSAMYSGYSMAGVTRRPTYWGGYEPRLIDAVSFCYVFFMRGPGDLDPDEPRSKSLYEYLDSLKTDADAPALPLSVVKDIADVPRGESKRGEAVYQSACQSCHGAIHSGSGRISDFASILPEVKNDYGQTFPGVEPSLVFIEKVRHGQFFGVGGNMPLFSKETLSDEDLGALLAYLGV